MWRPLQHVEVPASMDLGATNRRHTHEIYSTGLDGSPLKEYIFESCVWLVACHNCSGRAFVLFVIIFSFVHFALINMVVCCRGWGISLLFEKNTCSGWQKSSRIEH